MKAILLALIDLYRLIKRSVFRNHFGTCKFNPTCSAYAHEAICKYGALRGTYLAIKRILRCNPFSRGGYDPLK